MGDSFFMRLYTKEYLADSKVRALSREHRGDLVDLWCHIDQDGSIPSDPVVIGRLLGITPQAARKTLRALGEFFEQEDGRLFSPRLQKERQAREEVLAQRQKGASLTNTKRWGERSLSDSLSDTSSDRSATPERIAQVSPVSSQQSVKTTTPTPSGPGKPKKRRTRGEILDPFPAEVAEVVNGVGPSWRKQDPADERVITISVPDFAGAIDRILRGHPDLTPQDLIGAGRAYCEGQRTRYKAPQHFFGPDGPWPDYVRMSRGKGAA